MTEAATEVIVSPVQGYVYPIPDEETSAFKQLFQTSLYIELGCYVYLSNFLLNAKEGLCSHKLMECQIYPYKIVSIQISDGNLVGRTDKAIISPTKTKVVLEGKVKDDHQYSWHVSRYFSCGDNLSHWVLPSKLGSITFTLALSKLSQENVQFSIDFTHHDWKERLSTEVITYLEKAEKVTSLKYMNELEESFLRLLLCGKQSSAKILHSVLVDSSAFDSNSNVSLERSLRNLCIRLGLRFVTVESRLLAVRSDYSKLLSETAGLHSAIPYLPSVTADALQHLSGSNGIFLFIQDWDLVAQQATVDSHDTAVVSANSAAQMPIHQKTLQDIVCASLLELQHNLLASYQEKKSSVEQSMNTSVKDLVIIVAVTSSSSSWLPMWQQLHSPCRQAFPVLWRPFEPLDMHSSTVDMNSTSPDNCEKYQETESTVQFSVDALRYLSLVILDDDIHISQNEEKLKNSIVGALAVRESLERNFGWDYLREILPITDESTVSVQNWHRLLHGAHLNESFCTDKYIDVTIKDVQRAYCKLFPLQQLPSWHNADSNLSQKQAHKSSHKAKNKHIEPVYWEDIGGLERVRQEILDVLELPFHYPELFPPHAPRRQGVLLYGPPGTGKTLVAKAVATECNMAFLSVKGPELLDAYVGESEKNVRELFVKARRLAPCVLFFDEIDSLAPARAKRNDSGGGVTDRIVSQLLTEIDQLVTATSTSTGEAFSSLIKSESASVRASADSTNANHPRNSEHVSAVTLASVFVIAATNRPDLLDPALLRPGRFDRKIYLGVCSDVSARQSILQAQTRKFQLASDIDFAYIATHCLPKNVTGADLGAVSSSAFSSALERKLYELETLRMTQYGSSNESSEEELDFLEAFPDDKLQVIVTQQDFIAAARSLVPSVVDLSYYEELHATYDSSLPDSETIH